MRDKGADMLDKNITNAINIALTKLLNQKLREIGRTANMLWIGLGDDIVYVNIRGQSEIRSEYALHIQCDWEIVCNSETIVCQDDFYKAKDSSVTLPDDEEPPFGESKFDETVANSNEIIRANPVYVINFDTDAKGGFHLKLSNDFMIKVYPYAPSEGESWRFLMPGSDDRHLVIFESDEDD